MTNNIISSGSLYKLKRKDIDIDFTPEILNYTCNVQGSLPVFNDEFTSDFYTVKEVNNNDGTWTTSIKAVNIEHEFGLPTKISFRDNPNLIHVDNLAYTYKLTTACSMFAYCINLEYINTENFDTNNITDMNSMFLSCENLRYLNVLNFDMHNVTDIGAMFGNCYLLAELDVSGWDTGNIINMHGVFNAKDGTYLKLKRIIGIENWNVSNVTDMMQMFEDCSQLESLDLSGWRTNNVTTMKYMFRNCKSLASLNVSNWVTDQVTDMNGMFSNCGKLTSLDVSSFKTNLVTDMAYMFSNCQSLVSLDVSGFDTNLVTNMAYMFYHCDRLSTIDVSNFETGKVTNMQYLFAYCSSLTSLNVSGWSTDEVMYMNYMFYYCQLLTSLDVSNWEVGKVIAMESMFHNCKLLISLDVSKWSTGQVTRMDNMFNSCNAITSLDVSGWDTGNVVNMGCLFGWCFKLSNIDVSRWNTSKVVYASYMFAECVEMTLLDVSNWNTDSMTNVQNMFYNCFKLTSLDLSSWDTSEITNMQYLFRGCKELVSLNINNFDMSKVTNIESILNNCPKLQFVNMGSISTLNRLTAELPTRTTEGIIIVDEPALVSDANKTILANKKWTIKDDIDFVIAHYTFDSNIDSNYMPIFNNDFNTTELIVHDIQHKNGIVERTLMSYTNQPTHIQFGTSLTTTTTASSLLSVIDVNLSEVTSFEDMFKGCNNLVSVHSSELCKPTNVINMFEGCSNLTTFDFYEMDLSMLGNYSGMFKGCSSLNKIRIRNVDLTAILADEENTFGAEPRYIVTASELSETLIADLNTKGWTLKHLIARYKFDRDLYEDFIPNFNTEYANYEIFDYKDNIYNQTIRVIEHDNTLPTVMRFGITGDNHTDLSREKSLLKVYDMSTSNLIYANRMFGYCSNLTGIACKWNTDNVINVVDMFAHCNKLISIGDTSNFKTDKITTMQGMFYNCYCLSSLDVSEWDVSKVTNMYYMFNSCHGFASLDVSKWNTSQVTNTNGMFYNCTRLSSLDVSKWDTSNITDMASMFSDCYNLTSIDVSNFNTSKVTNMNKMFYKCYNLASLDVSNWDTSKVTDMAAMFQECYKLTSIDVSRWNTDKITAIHYMFNACTSLKSLQLGNWNTSKVGTMHFMFASCSSLSTLNINNFVINGNTNIDTLFSSGLSVIKCNNAETIRLFTPKLIKKENSLGTIISDAVIPQETLTALAAKNWNVISPDSFIKVAEYAYGPDIWGSIIPEFDAGFVSYFIEDEEITDYVTGETINVINEDGVEALEEVTKTAIKRTIFSLEDLPTLIRFGTTVSSLSSINQKPYSSLYEVLYLNTNNMTNMNAMFRDCRNLYKVNCEGWNTNNVTNMSYMFCHCDKLTTIDVSGFNTSNVTVMTSMFNDCKVLQSLNVSNFNTSKVTMTTSMFQNCNNLVSLDVSKWDVSKVKRMDYMFQDCFKLALLDVSGWNTESVADVNSMFWNCNELTELNVSNWKTDNIIATNHMFGYCYKVAELDVSNWKTDNMVNMEWMFSKCNSIKALDLSNWNASKVTKMGRFIDCTSLEQLDMGTWYTPSVKYIDNFINNTKLTYLDLSNFIYPEATIIYTLGMHGNNNLTDIGMIYCDVTTINKVASTLNNACHRTIWIGSHLTEEEKASLNEYDHITYSVQSEDADRLLLTSPLLEGDEIKVIDGQLCHVHNMGMITLDGSSDETIGISSTTASLTNTVRFYLNPEAPAVNNPIASDVSNVKCNNFAPLAPDFTIQTAAMYDVEGISLGSSTVNNDTNEIRIAIKRDKLSAINIDAFKLWLQANPTTIIYELAEPYTEVIDLPRANINVSLYTNGTLYMSDPTASITQEESSTNLIINAIQGDSVVNVSNQQFPMELSDKNVDANAPEGYNFSGEIELNYLLANTLYKVSFKSNKEGTVVIDLGGAVLSQQSVVKGLNEFAITTPEMLLHGELKVYGNSNIRISNIMVNDSAKTFDYFKGINNTFDEIPVNNLIAQRTLTYTHELDELGISPKASLNKDIYKSKMLTVVGKVSNNQNNLPVSINLYNNDGNSCNSSSVYITPDESGCFAININADLNHASKIGFNVDNASSMIGGRQVQLTDLMVFEGDFTDCYPTTWQAFDETRYLAEYKAYNNPYGFGKNRLI